MSTTRPRTATDDSRSRILLAAAEICAERGYDGTTIARICERSGLPPSSIYWFFTGKDELLGEVVRHSFVDWDAQGGWPEPEPGADVLVALRQALGGLARSVTESPDFLRIGLMLALERRDDEAEGRRAFIEIHRRAERTIADWFRAMLDRSTVEREPLLPERLATLIMASSDGLFIGRQISDAVDLQAQIDLTVTIVETALTTARAAG